MTEVPDTRYARSADGTQIAYQVVGDGPFDLVFLPGLAFPIDVLWDDPGFLRVATRLAGFGRTVWCETRGYGSSEGDPRDTADEIADADLTAVLDAAGCDRVTLVGYSHTGPRAIRYAATTQSRVSALVLLSTFAHYVRADDYRVGLPAASLDRFEAAARQKWGTGVDLDFVAPSRMADERFRRWWARCERLGSGPDQHASLLRESFCQDVRPLLSRLRAPTLVLHQRGNRYIHVAAGRYLAEHIEGAKYVELPGDDHLFFVGDTDALIDEIEEFLTGRHQPAEGDVILATVLFTDIVNSTGQEAEMGHRAWTRLTEEHDALVRGALGRHRGRMVKSMGDGFLATFDGGTRAVRCALEILKEAKELGLELRAGLHTGEVEVRGDDVAGLAVTVGKRICDLAGPRQVLVSETVKGLIVGSGIAVSEHGSHVLKGVPETWRLFSVVD